MREHGRGAYGAPMNNHGEHAGPSTPLVLVAAAIATGLLAGFFYAYSVSVMPGLDQADDRTLVDGMQQINEVVANPVFFLSFGGAPILIVAAVILARRSGAERTTRWIVAALVLYGVAFFVTVAFNIPLNDDLEDAGDPGRIAELAAVRDDFYGPWVAWNIVRTVVSTAALGCLAYALLLYGRRAATP
jgi:uncharacterized membrane protein